MNRQQILALKKIRPTIIDREKAKILNRTVNFRYFIDAGATIETVPIVVALTAWTARSVTTPINIGSQMRERWRDVTPIQLVIPPFCCGKKK